MTTPLPLPKSLTYTSNDLWPLEGTVCAECEAFTPAARALCDAMQRTYGMYARLTANAESFSYVNEQGARIIFRHQEMTGEAYRVESREGVAVTYASTLDGAAHAASALFQMIQMDERRALLAEFTIEDAPDVSWRGVMLDLARNYFPLAALLRTVDLCWLTRCNRLHLHFADGPIYRLPSKAYPKIVSPDAYTKEEIGYLTQYADARGVMVIPEIEMPGHASAFTKAYPELFANAGNPARDDAVCAGKPGVFERLEQVLREVAELFPGSPYLHIGGDEVSTRLWADCEDCVAYMKGEGVADAHALYAHFIEKLTKSVVTIGKTPIVWEGFPAEGSENIPRETIVMEFESLYQTAPELLDAGFRLVNTAWKPLYVLPQATHCPSASPASIYAWNMYRWENWFPKSRAYPHGIEVEPTDRVLGAQICMWEGNDIVTRKAVREALFALAERLWNVERRVDFDSFWLAASSALSRCAPIKELPTEYMLE